MKRGNFPMKCGNSLLLCAALMGGMAPFALLGCGGCANQNNAASAERTLSGVETRPPAANLSAEAEDTYAYLVLMQLMGGGGEAPREEDIRQAVALLKRSRVPASAWLDGFDLTGIA